MSAFSGIYGLFPLCSDDLITPRSKISWCARVWVEWGEGMLSNTQWPHLTVMHLITHLLRYSSYCTDEDEVYPLRLICSDMCVHVCAFDARRRLFINVLIRWSVNTGALLHYAQTKKDNCHINACEPAHDYTCTSKCVFIYCVYVCVCVSRCTK